MGPDGRTIPNLPISFPIPSEPPKAPSQVAVSAASESTLHISWAPPLDDGGAELLSYKVEWDGHAGVQEQQRLSQSQRTDAGTFRLIFDGATTAPIPHDASAKQLASALNALHTVGETFVTRTESPSGYEWIITFLDNVGDLPLLEVTSSQVPISHPRSVIWLTNVVSSCTVRGVGRRQL